MPRYNRIIKQDVQSAKVASMLDARIINNARVQDICNEFPEAVNRMCTRSRERRQQYWCADHSEPRAICGCDPRDDS